MNIIVETDTYDQLSHTFPHLLAISQGESRVEVSTPSAHFISPLCPQKDEKDLLASKVDLVVTLGGDGTILHVSSLFDQAAVPPVLSFSMGTLGFLLPYGESLRTRQEIGGDSELALARRHRLVRDSLSRLARIQSIAPFADEASPNDS